jgi:hypothetical protein
MNKQDSIPELEESMSPEMQSNIVASQESLDKTLSSEHYEPAWLDQSFAFVSQWTTRLVHPLILDISIEHVTNGKDLGIRRKLWRDIPDISLLRLLQLRILGKRSLNLPQRNPQPFQLLDMLLVKETRGRRRITYELINAHFLPLLREILIGHYDLPPDAIVNVVYIKHPVVLVIHLLAGHHQDPSEKCRHEHVLLQANQVVRHLPGQADGEQEPVFLRVPLNCPPVGRQFLSLAPGNWEIEIHPILRSIAGPGAVRGEECCLDLAVDLDLALQRRLEIGEGDGCRSRAVCGRGAVEEAEKAGALGAEEVKRVELGLAHAGGGGVGGEPGGGEADRGGQRGGAAEGEEEDEEEEREGDEEEEVAAGPERAAERGGGGGERGAERRDGEGRGRRAGEGGGGVGFGVVLGDEGLEVVVLVGDGRVAVHGGGGGGECRCGSEQRGRREVR